MEQKIDLKENNNIFLCKKTKTNQSKSKQKIKDCSKLKDTNKSSILFESSTEFSIKTIDLEEKPEFIPGLDDINIPSFLNDITKYNIINKKIKNYYKIRKELGSKADLYLIDVNTLYEEKKKI